MNLFLLQAYTLKQLLDLAFFFSLEKKAFYDSCAGSGGVLTFANKELREKELNTEFDFYGQEINNYSYALCKANLLINGLESRNIELGDSLCANKIKKNDFIEFLILLLEYYE